MNQPARSLLIRSNHFQLKLPTSYKSNLHSVVTFKRKENMLLKAMFPSLNISTLLLLNRPSSNEIIKCCLFVVVVQRRDEGNLLPRASVSSSTQ